MLGVVALENSTATRTAAAQPTPAVLDAVNTIGLNEFPHTYLSAKITGPRAITIYRTVHDPALISAVRAVDGLSAYRIAEQPVAHSFATLEALTTRIAGDLPDLAAAGLNMVVWAPDARSDTVSVTLTPPAGSDSTAPSAAAVAAATKILNARYGSGRVSVSPVARPYPIEQKGRDTDTKPFFAGDGYATTTSGGLLACTSGFAVEDAHAHRPNLLSAGHCGAVGDATTLGTVSKRYDTRGWDFETIDVAGGSETRAGSVWFAETGTSDSYRVIGAVTPTIGTEVTEDGDTSGYGQHTGNTVMGIGACFVETSVSDQRHTVCNAGYAEHAGTVCDRGDSGGPVYVPSSSPDAVYAVGIHLAGSASHGTDTCYFQEIIPALIHGGLGLLTTDAAGSVTAAWTNTGAHGGHSKQMTTPPLAVPPWRWRTATRSIACGLTVRRRRSG
jgi:hypothetical protein